ATAGAARASEKRISGTVARCYIAIDSGSSSDAKKISWRDIEPASSRKPFAVYLTASGGSDDDTHASSTLGVRDTNKMTDHRSSRSSTAGNTVCSTRSTGKGSRSRSKDIRTHIRTLDI